MRTPLHLVFLLVFLPVTAGHVAAQAKPDPVSTAEEMVSRERLRSAVEQALELVHAPASSGAMKIDNFVNASEDLVRLGADAVPYLTAELDQGLESSFFICAYALGKIGGSEADKALRQAIVKAERDPGDYALARKTWAVYGLALMGADDAVDLIYEGRHLCGPNPIHGSFSLVEVAALLTAPESVPRLFEIQSRLAEDPEMLSQRMHVARAFWRMPDPANVPKLLEMSRDDSQHIRREAIHALAYIPTPEAQAAVLAALDDQEPQVRLMAANALQWSERPLDPAMIAGKLETENESRIRSIYYRLLADRMGPDALPLLSKYWGRPDPTDRTALIFAVGLSGSSESLPLLRQALADPDSRVVAWAVRGVGTLKTDEARAILLQMLRSTVWSAVQASVEELLAAPADDAAPAIAKRLFDVDLRGVMTDVHDRHHALLLADALVELAYTPALPKLREAAERQVDPTLKEKLRSPVAKLAAYEQLGDDRARWFEAVQSPELDARTVAYRLLARDGGADGAAALAKAFGRVEPEEGERILDELAASRTVPAQDLIERVLIRPEFDPADRETLRTMAAWSARRIGGKRMSAALRESAERRDGRDVAVLIYLAVLDGESALPILERYRLPRLRYLKGSRGSELRRLDWLARRIAAGRSLAAFDVPPNKLQW